MRLLAVVCLALVVTAHAIPILEDTGAGDVPAEDRFESLEELDDPPKPAGTPAATEAPKAYEPADAGYRVPCDITAERGICLFNGAKVLVPDAAPKGLVAAYSFDDGHVLDHGHNKLHGATVVPAAPGRGGQGNAARMEGEAYMEVPDAKVLHQLAQQFSITFWMFLPTPNAVGTAPKDTQCTFAYLGETDGKKSAFQLDINPKLKSLRASCSGNKFSVESNARLSSLRWYHIAMTRSKTDLTLYVNGVRDVSIPAAASETFTKTQFFMGRLPHLADGCANVPMFVDDLQIYDHELSGSFIEAQAFPALGGIKPGFIRLGCKKCSFDEAAKKCTGSYHLCYQNDLMAGALTAARALGYVQYDTETHVNDVFTQTQTHKTGPGIPDQALGLCCRGE